MVPRKDPQPPKGYTPRYGWRDFDQMRVHRNGTYYDDEGYDFYFLDRNEMLRPDKVPPFEGVYVLGLLVVVQKALEMAEAFAFEADSEEWRSKMEGVYFSPLQVNMGESVYDYDRCEDYKDQDCELYEYDPPYGTLYIGEWGDFGSSRYPCGFCPFVTVELWDEEFGRPMVDQKDFIRALGQIGEQIEAENRTDAKDIQALASAKSIFSRVHAKDTQALACAARLLKQGEIWEEKSIAEWAATGMNMLTGLESWDNSVEELRGLIAVEEEAPAHAGRYDAGEKNPESYSDEDIPF